ncbi:hypothetical protein EV356DRAFT_530687 [Viridothelium virens]|uniref:Rhodopsin domain-containing protein n=1 Tax=Viridothelium virens TaxID=1048519 RepID=A0A6A6HGV8_VIRVR|nr:hypothetical protein EV356DRAFT_530687 [Viridothelium virens]
MSTFNLPPQLVFHGNGGTYSPHGTITSEDHGPAIVAFSWIFYSLTSLTVLARLITRRNLVPDYWCLLIAWVLLTLESVSIHLAANNGMGRHISSLSSDKYDAYSRAFYASQTLTVLIVALAKISYLTIFVRLLAESSGQRKTTRQLCVGLIVVVALWAFSISLALALQCRVPHPWRFLANTCIDQRALYYFTGVFDIVTDLVLVALPPVIVATIQLETSVKVTVVAIFGTRIIVPVFTIVELSLLPQYLGRGDPTWYSVTLTIWAQAACNMSLLTACLPSVKPFLNMLQFSLIDCSTLPFSAPSGSCAEVSPLYKSDGSTLVSDRNTNTSTPTRYPYESDDNVKSSPLRTGG